MSAPRSPGPSGNESNQMSTVDHSESEDDVEAEADVAKGVDGQERKHLFSEELKCMMHACGDDQNPYTDSVNCMEEIVIEFIKDLTQKAMNFGKAGRVTVEDLKYFVREHKEMYSRVEDLLEANEELNEARKAFDEDKYATDE